MDYDSRQHYSNAIADEYPPAHNADGSDVMREMDYQRSQQDSEEINKGERFFDSGTRIPGNQAGKNLNYERRLGLKNSIVK